VGGVQWVVGALFGGGRSQGCGASDCGRIRPFSAGKRKQSAGGSNSFVYMRRVCVCVLQLSAMQIRNRNLHNIYTKFLASMSPFLNGTS